VLQEDPMLQQFYIQNNQKLFWFNSNKNIKRARVWLRVVAAADVYPSVSTKLAMEKINTALDHKNMIDSIYKMEIDRQITWLVLSYIKNQQEGTKLFDYDDIAVKRDSVYIDQLKQNNIVQQLSKFECKDPAYVLLKNYLADSITTRDTLKYKSIQLAMNYRSYFSINHQSEYIVVNVLSAEAEYYKNNTIVMGMRVVVGQKANPTPLFASYITSLVTFPHWNVPQSIAVKELIPKVQKDKNYLEQNGFEVVDAKGNEVDDSELHWKEYTENNFPFFFRQSTGGDNALGILKFNLKNPYSVFLHATSNQEVFSRSNRFLSHGCIRLEKPFELANALLENKLNVEEMKTAKKYTESNTIMLPHKIPTFIIYMPVKIVGKKITFLPDVYGLFK
jgi:murein L,D-transpeptidase YcbB/YkuD